LDEPPSLIILNILSDNSLLYFFLTAVFLLFSAWASAVEGAFFSLNSDDIDRFGNSTNENERTAAMLLANSRLLLSVLTMFKYAMLSGVATLVIAVFSASEGNTLLNGVDTGSSILFLTVVFALFGVIVPKIYGATHNRAISRKNSRLCKKLITVFKPFLKPLLRTSIEVEKKLDAKTEQKSVEELTQALQLATVDNEPIEGEKEILEGIVNFGTLTVKQVMRPRPEISFTDFSLTFHQLIEFVKKSGYSRVPACRGSLDKVEGILYIKDLLPFLEEGPDFQWQKLVRPGYFVPETKKIDLLLKDFQEKRVHMALVVNAQNVTNGLITLEDIIEEIIGDINDEFDEVGVRYQKISERIFLFDGKTSVHEFCKVLHIDAAIFQRTKGINESLGGVLVEVNEKLPVVGDKIVIEPFTFVIESVDNKRIKKVRVELHEPKEK
jgi:putative hemolysin